MVLADLSQLTVFFNREDHKGHNERKVEVFIQHDEKKACKCSICDTVCPGYDNIIQSLFGMLMTAFSTNRRSSHFLYPQLIIIRELMKVEQS